MNQINQEPDDKDLQQLLHTVGSRITPPAELVRDVREAVHCEWRAVVAERERTRVKLRRRVLAWSASIAASVALLISFVLMRSSPTPEIALVARIEGQVSRDAGLLHAAQTLTSGDRVHVGDELTTTSRGRVAFASERGIAFRLDANTRIEVIAPHRVLLRHGALYVDADPATRAAAQFAVDTRNGTVHHIGTQYEVRDLTDAVQISVREGRVGIEQDGILHPGSAGERIALRNDGQVERTAIAANDSQWQWIAQVAPAFDIENQPLIAFLEWFERETGHTVQFAEPALADSASSTVLRGSIEGLEPRDALTAVLATANLTYSEIDDRIIIASHD